MLLKNVFVISVIFIGWAKGKAVGNTPDVKRNVFDESVYGYLMERTCWWNEVCKEEFQNLFRCRCPTWSYCRAPGRYYNAYCAMSATGYIWSQPQWNLRAIEDKKSVDNRTNFSQN